MLFHWIYPLSSGDAYKIFNVFKYITVRSFIAFVIALIISIIWGKRFIAFMRLKQFGQAIREEGPAAHKKKAGTPTFGGVFILGSTFISLAITGNFHSLPLLAVLFVTISYFLLGFVDDYLKVMKRNSDGVSGKGKLLWQFLTAAIVMYWVIANGIITTDLYLPFLKDPILNMGWLYLGFGCIVIVGSSNAVNLTDGLDGLAIGPIITSSASLGLLAYVAGHFSLSNYLLIPYTENVGEILVFASAIIGAGLGFLWYNAYPAQVFMGDVGSLSLGGCLGMIAI